jgi:hypothetical protein
MQRPWFRSQTWSWYVEVDGRQHNLGKHTSDEAPRKGKRGWSPPPEIERAWREFCGCHEAGIPEATGGPRQDRPVAEVCHPFLAAARGHIGRETGENYRHYLQDFLDRHPGLMVAGVTRELVRAWLDAERDRRWGVSSHRGAITALKRA